MSNLTPDDVDLRLTATKAELTEEDQRLWLGLEDEKISRIAGDEANKQFTELVQQQNSGTESRLSTEVIHRSEGDVSNLNSLNAVAQALSDYRIKTDLEINNEVIARKALGVELNSLIDTFMASWDHDKFLIYRTIQEVQDDVDGKYVSMDTRITKYEQMLSDITSDSIQITMDNGEINMGAWTILSQAREWDLQIIGRMKDFQIKTEGDLNQALEDIQNSLPVEQDIVDRAIEALSNAPIIKELDEKIAGSIADIGAVNLDLVNEITARQNEMVAQAQNTANALKAQADALNASVTAEANERIDALLREATIREDQLRQEAIERSEEIDTKLQDITVDLDSQVAALNTRVDQANAKVTAIETNVATQVTSLNNKADIIRADLTAEENARITAISGLNDGLTQEIQFRKDGDTANIAALENYKTSNDTALANVRVELGANVTATTANAANITSLDTRLEANETLAASAVSKAETALTQNTTMAVDITSVKASITGLQGDLDTKADADAFNQLKTQVTNIDGQVTTQASDITALQTTATSQGGAITANTSAISQLETVQTSQGNKIAQLTTDTTVLQNGVTDLQDDMATKVESAAFNQLKSEVTKNAGDIVVNTSDVTSLKGEVSTIKGQLSTKAEVSALQALDTKITTVDGKTVVNADAITSLKSRMTTAEGEINTKLDAEIIDDYSTTVQTNQAIADRITSYNASLRIGGNNIWEFANTGSSDYGSATVIQVGGNPQHQKLTITAVASNLFSRLWSGVRIANAEPMDLKSPVSFSVDVFPVYNKVRISVHPWKAAHGIVNQLVNVIPNQWNRIVLENILPPTDGTGVDNYTGLFGIRYAAADLGIAATGIVGKTIEVRDIQLQSGSKATEYVKPSIKLETSIAANATAIQGINSSVSNIDGRVTSNSNSITTLANRVTNAETNISNKADASAVSTLSSKVDVMDGKITSQGADITRLDNEVGTIKADMTTLATSSALQALDSKVTVIDGRVSTNANAITSLSGRVTTAEQGLATKLDADVINAYSTTVDMNSAIANSITTYNANLVIGGVNQLINSEAERVNTGTVSREYLLYERSTHLKNFYNENLGKDVTISFEIKVPVAGVVQVYSSKGSAHTFTVSTPSLAADTWTKVVITVKPRLHSTTPDNVAGSTLEFYGTYSSGRIPTVCKVQLEAGNKATAWSPSPRDTQAALDANATAIQSINANVTALDGRITANSSALTSLANRVNVAEGAITQKADSSAVSALTTEVTRIDGAVSVNSDSITGLTSRIGTVEGQVATKAEASALQNYYTKTEAADNATTLAAGEVAKYDASLVIGGSNLQDNADFKTTSLNRWAGIYGAVTAIKGGIQYKGTSVSAAARMEKTLAGLEVGQTYTLSVWAKSPVPLEFRGPVDATAIKSIMPEIHDPSVFQRYTYTFIPSVVTGAKLRAYVPNIALTDLVVINKEKLEIGSKGTDWSQSFSDIQSALDTNSTAIQNTNAEVTRVDGLVTTANNATTTLAGRVSTVEGAVATKAEASALTALTTRVTNAEGVNTSQGTAITTLQNTVNHATTGLATKASSTALTAVDNRVTAVDNRVTVTNSNVTALTGRVSTVESGLVTKADVNALTALGTTVTAHGNDLNTKSNQITELTAGIENVNLRGQDLVSNGLGQLQSNKYWSALTFTAMDKPAGVGSFVSSSGQQVVIGDEFIAVDPARSYKLAYYLRQTAVGVSARGYGMIAPYDVDKNQISPQHYMVQANTLTTLAVPLKKGDTTMTLTSAANWYNLSNSSSHLRSAIFWNYTDKTGYTWPVNTYSRNVWLNLYDGGAINGNVITLKTPWSGLNIPAGTQVSNGSAGGAYMYIGAVNFIIPQDWTAYSGKFEGTHTNNPASATNRLPMMTAYVKVGFLFNRSDSGPNVAGSRMAVGGLSIRDWSVAGDPELAKASALTSTDTEVSRINGVVVTQGTSITNLQAGLATTNNNLATKADSSALTSLTTRVTNAEGSITSQGSRVTNLENAVNSASTGLSTKASSAALTALDNKVTAVDGKVTTNASNITALQGKVTTVENGLVTKADATVLTDLTTRVSNTESTLSTQSTSLTNLRSDLTATTTSTKKALEAVEVKDTRSTNELPSWYWTNHAKRIVNEFKSASVIGVTGLGAYVNLETRVYYSDASGGPIVQTAIGASNPLLQMVRRSSGSASAAVWTAWEQPLKAINDEVNTKASASALSTLDTKVTAIDGKVTTHASSITQLQADVSGNSSKLIVQGDVVDGLKASYVVKTDVNGLVAGYGLYNTGSSSAFGVNADYFYVGKGTAATNGKKPFMVLTKTQTISGVTYPAGTWIDVALIANATIGTAHIADASITNAKISSLDAAKITTGTLDAARIKVGAATQYEIGYDPITKARTFVAQPVTPYRIGDIWKDGNTTAICTVTRLTGAYVAADWGKTGDVTSLNTAADTSKVGGVAAATVNQNITNAQTAATNAATLAGNKGEVIFGTTQPATDKRLAQNLWIDTTSGANTPKRWNGSAWVAVTDKAATDAKAAADAADSKATAAQTAADSANNQVNAWKFTGTTEIDGGKIRADTVTAVQIDVAELSAISANLGTLTSTSPQGTTTMTGSLIEVRDSSGQLRVKLGVW